MNKVVIFKVLIIFMSLVVISALCLSSYLACDFNDFSETTNDESAKNFCSLNSSCMDLPSRNARFEAVTNIDFAQLNKSYNIYIFNNVITLVTVFFVLKYAVSIMISDKRIKCLCRLLI